MKRIIRAIVISFISLYAASLLLPSFSYSGSYMILAKASIVFALTTVFIKPVLKIVTIPINWLTLGLFACVLNVFILYITIGLVNGVYVTPFYFAGYSYNGFIFPAIAFTKFWSLVLTSFFISWVSNLLKWLYD